MLNHLSILLAGFSFFAALILLFLYLFSLPNMRKNSAAKLACTVVLTSLAALQAAHYLYFLSGVDVLQYRAYGVLLIIVPPSFYFFSRGILFPEVHYHVRDLLHGVFPLISMFLPIDVIPGLAFLFGTGYTFWFARVIYMLRDQRARFRFEMFFFGMFAAMALSALMLGLALPYLDARIFYLVYSNAIALALLLVVAALLAFPELLSDIMDIAELTYAKSKLVGIDTGQKLQELEHLMTVDKHYENEKLSLSSLAELLNLSSHQLSELINTQCGYGFPRFIREHRVRAAKTMLIEQPRASILSISMATGFNSQSNFYTAFKEITGESPGSFRSNHLP